MVWCAEQVDESCFPKVELTDELIISDSGVTGWNCETQKELTMKWAHMENVKVRFYKISKRTSRYRCKFLCNYDNDEFNIYADEELSIKFGFGVCEPRLLLTIANRPSPEFNKLEITGHHDPKRGSDYVESFKFRIAGFNVEKSVGADSDLKSLDTEEQFVNLFERKRAAYIENQIGEGGTTISVGGGRAE